MNKGAAEKLVYPFSEKNEVSVKQPRFSDQKIPLFFNGFFPTRKLPLMYVVVMLCRFSNHMYIVQGAFLDALASLESIIWHD